MRGVISLGVGEPDFQTPWQIRKAGINSLEKGRTKYTSNKGYDKLLKEISNYLNRRFSLNYNPEDEILVTVGGSEAIDACIRAIVSPGDEVIIPQPSYVCYEPITQLAGGKPVIINTKAENDFKVTPEELKAVITDKTKILILPYPCNPTGAIMEKEDIEKLYEVIKDTNIIVLSDEIYSELIKSFPVDYDESGSICKRYRRQDEIGTPYCVTVDFDTLEDNAVTVRDRDTMEQVRIPIAELKNYITEKIKF